MPGFLRSADLDGTVFRHRCFAMEYITTPKVEQVKLLDRYTSKKPTFGTLYLTTTHLIYVENSSENRKETWILHHHIATVEKLPLTAAGCPLLIYCKNFRVVHFMIPRERDCQDVFQSLLKLSQPAKHEELYAFLYNPKQDENDRRIGWATVDLKMDYGRMGLPNDLWEMTDLNRNYVICSTYPADLAVPTAASKATIVGSSKFRSRGRFPVLSYFYKPNNAAICRCSQPLSGFNARCVEDEQMLKDISKANPNSSFMYVVDTRPKLNAMANRAAGKGYENEDHYSNIRFQFVGIENIHVMRSSLQKLVEVCTTKSPTMSDFLTGLENSGWLRHIKAVMDAGLFLVKAVLEEKASVLVHCSDGWDRTAQVCSLAAILLDPFYRTIRGLMVRAGSSLLCSACWLLCLSWGSSRDWNCFMLQLNREETEDNGEIRQLIQAVSNDDDTLLAELLSRERYKNSINKTWGWGVPGTPLRMAASWGRIRCLEVLLAHGAEVDSLDVKAQTPLFTAVNGRHLNCVLALLKAGANPNGSIYNNCSPVLTAAREGDAEILKELLKHGAEVNARSKVLLWASNTSISSGPLYLSAVYGHLECFKILLLYGADPDYNCNDEMLLKRIKQPKTVLEMCLRHGCGVEYIQLLIDFGANVYLPTLIIEKSTKQNEAVELLLKERGCPKSLMSQCRIAIRTYLRKINRMNCIDCLEVPPILMNFLKYRATPTKSITF
ncbi:myotubularin-related protein 8-like isoform X2 [Arapaima gigas]